ncbi:MAG: CotH kinase family protein, partial [Clostridiales bacterium]|nr:CotH kinase family protein [Clostridiales bacterium]
ADSVTIGIDDGDGMLYYYYEEVGVRMKGNTSRHEFYNNDGFFDNIHMKLSFKQTFDDVDDGYTEDELKVWTDDAARAERKDRMFAGMEKIDIKYNSTRDETYVREMYAMKLFRESGVIAPNVTMCSVTALEKDATRRNLGVYRIHEPIDEAFIERNFDDAEVGDLWKCTYTKTGPADLTNYDLDNRIGVEDEMKGRFYSYDKKTNKKKDKETGLRDFSSMKNFIAAISGENADYSAALDTDAFARFEAVNYILGNPDCIRNNYNNYYIYFRKSDGKAVIIPYDYDRCLGLTEGWNPTGSASMYLEPYTRRIAASGDGQYNPLYKNLICKGAPTDSGSTLMKYRDDLISMSSGERIKASAFTAYKDKFKERYSKYVTGAVAQNALAFDSTNTGNVSYSQYIEKKLETLLNNIDNYN